MVQMPCVMRQFVMLCWFDIILCGNLLYDVRHLRNIRQSWRSIHDSIRSAEPSGEHDTLPNLGAHVPKVWGRAFVTI